MSRRTWTDAEIGLLREHFPREGAAAVARQILKAGLAARTIPAIYTRARIEGLKAPGTKRERAPLQPRRRPTPADLPTESLGRVLHGIGVAVDDAAGELAALTARAKDLAGELRAAVEAADKALSDLDGYVARHLATMAELQRRLAPVRSEEN